MKTPRQIVTVKHKTSKQTGFDVFEHVEFLQSRGEFINCLIQQIHNKFIFLWVGWGGVGDHGRETRGGLLMGGLRTHWLGLKRHLVMAWPGHGQVLARQHILGNGDV